MKSIARLLVFLGCGGAALAALVPWADVHGKLPVPVRLDWLRTTVPATGKEVSGLDTPAWPFLIGIAGLVAALVVANKLRKLVMLFGGLLTVGGAGLLYYVNNAVDIETRGADIRSQIKHLLATNVVESDAKLGPYLLIVSGLLIVVGAVKAFD